MADDRARPEDRQGAAASDAAEAAASARPRVTADTSVNETIARFPSTAEVFVQYGPLHEARPGQLYLAYRDWTVGAFAAARGVDLARLLQQLNAEAEGAGAAVDAAGGPRGRRWHTGFARVAIGYTGSYEERDDVEIEEVSVVDVQNARGPD